MKYESKDIRFKKQYELMKKYPLIGSLYKNVNKITIHIIEAYNKEEIGRKISFSKSDSLYIYLECSFAQCLSTFSGMNLTDCVCDAIQQHLAEVKCVRISCGNPYEYSCDNYVIVNINIEYIK